MLLKVIKLPHVAANQSAKTANTERVLVNSRTHEIMNKITVSKKNTGKENEHITLSNPYAIFELDTI
jgi:hypothetical protein